MKILIFHASAGYGHKKVADVLGKGFSKYLPAEDMTIRDALDLSPAIFRNTYPSFYFYLVKYLPAVWGWFYEWLDSPWFYRLLRPVRSALNRFYGKKLLGFVIQEKPDVILCTHFFSAEVLASAKLRGVIDAKLVTFITDFFPHTFWVNDGTDFYWVMNEASKKDLIHRGVPETTIMAGGISVGPLF